MIELNKLYCMDNLDLLRQLPNESVDLIYGDVLYGTGKNFRDYKDLKPNKDIIEDFYYPRIKEMHRILKNTGSIYLQMDSRIVHWIRCLMDGIFGYENFRSNIVWCYATQGSSKNNFASKYDDIIYYAKDRKKVSYNPQKQKNYSPHMAGRENSIKYGGRWDDEPCITCGNKNNWVTDINMRNYWLDIYPVRKRNNKEFVDYNTQKPKKLLERIIKASSNEGDVVADFFMGSGTTIKVAKKLGRNYIGCDINPRAIEITEERLSKLDLMKI